MSVEVTLKSLATVVETPETNMPAVSDADKTVTHDGFNTSKTLNASSTPAVHKVACFEQALTAGSATIDLTALTGTNGATVDGTGQKVQVFKAKAPATNANPITIGEGAANGYELAGNAWKMILQPGQEFLFYGDGDTPAIGAAAKDIDLAGTGAQKLEIEIVTG